MMRADREHRVESPTYLERLGALIRMLEPTLCLPSEATARFDLYRALVNQRPPTPVPPAFLRLQDEVLQARMLQKGIVDVMTLAPIPSDKRILLWQGDITRLAVDAIVNAANSQMLGCFLPCHACIDNVIHTQAGVQLRQACHEIMLLQRHDEEPGQAKITPAFNLSSRYVLHTVGPIVDGALTSRHCKQLASCYRSCLALASEHGLRSIAFCCISTGVFRFPKEEAAQIAVHTVKEYLGAGRTSIERVVFDVYEESDLRIYKRLLDV